MDGAERVEPAVVFVGAWVPDLPVFHGSAFNRAGQMYQRGLARAWSAAGLAPSTIYSIEPLPAFPRSARLFGRRGHVGVEDGRIVRFLPFVNVHPLKAITAGLVTVGTLIGWAWRHRKQPRIIHCFNLTMPPGIFLLFAARLTGSRAFVSLADVCKPGAIVPDTWAWRLDYWLQRQIIPRFDGILLQSRAIADELARGRHVCQINGGILGECFAAAPVARSGEKPFRVVLAGSLEPYNGVDVVLQAFDDLGDDVALIVAGKGSAVDRVTRAAAGDPRITYAGELGFGALIDLYRSADLLLNVRLTQAIDTHYFFPSKLMELLASGVPVLSTRSPDIVSEFGSLPYFLSEETPRAVADAIAAIARIPPDERRERGRRAWRFMLEHRTWEAQGPAIRQYVKAESPRAAEVPG
jgi:glycosyltransferase involved in cell wall biosynthesis